MARRTDKEGEGGREGSGGERRVSFFYFRFILFVIYGSVGVGRVGMCAFGVWCEVWCVHVCGCLGFGVAEAGRLVVRTSIFSKRSLCFPGTSAECLAAKLVELLKLSLSLSLSLSLFFFLFPPFEEGGRGEGLAWHTVP
ncbi:hypothetical protein HOY82DRAFT_99569 [Tuber indicum]|nr:hypothetical protein HOY82DRAFT_99569 [Tuber indicum]